MLDLSFVNQTVSSITSWVEFIGWLGVAAVMTWAASAFSTIAEQGWGAVVFAGIGAACVVSLCVSASLVAWRWFYPFPKELSDVAPQIGGAMTGEGVEFFPDRNTLVRAHGTLGQRLASASSASGIWVVGQKFYHADENVSVMKRLLLPNPDGVSFIYSAEPYHPEIAEYIRHATNKAIESGTRVRWYDHFVFQSIMLVDTDKPSGWVHVELVLPHSKVERRPGFTVYKRQSEDTVSELQRIFNEMWDDAKEPNRS